MAPRSINDIPSVAHRLRLGVISLIAITAVLICFVLIGYIFINVTQDNTLKQQARLLNETEQISDFGPSFVELATQLAQVQSMAELSALEETSTNVIPPLVEYIDLIIEQSNESERQNHAAEIKDLFSQSQQLLVEVIQTKRNTFIKAEEYEQAHNKAYGLKQEIMRHIDRESLAANLNFYKLSDAKPDSGYTKDLQTAYENNLRFAELKSNIGELYDDLASLQSASALSDVDVIENHFLFVVRRFSSTSSELNNDKALAALARELFSYAVLDSPLFRTKRQLIQEQTATNKDIEKLNFLAEKILESKGRYREAILRTSAESALHLKFTTISTIVALSFVVVILVAVLVYFFRTLIYNNLIQPMLELTKVTQSLSQGDLTTEIPHYQFVELKSMAESLDTFRANAFLLTKTNMSLRTANASLENFAYAASHDLKSPLRGIANLADFLKEDLEGKVDDESFTNIEQIKQRVLRLESLLTDLLSYAKSESNQDPMEEVLLPDFIEEIFSLLNSGSNFSLRVDTPLSSITVVVIPLRQVIHNLISNALKHHDRDHGEIVVRIDDIGDAFEIEVSDDGPGIEPKFHKKVFELFQTLQPRDIVEGSGMGLALVSKLLESVGGRIELISDAPKQRGTAFKVIWPKNTVM